MYVLIKKQNIYVNYCTFCAIIMNLIKFKDILT